MSCTAHSQEPSPRSGKDVEKQQTQTTENKQNTTPNVHGTKEYPFVIEALPAPKSKEQTAREHYEHHEKPTLDRWLTYATVALVGVTAMLAAFTYFLWGATRMLVIDAKDTAERQLRAYLWQSADVEAIRECPESYVAGIKIMNGGQTPAYDVRCWVRLAAYEHPLNNGFQFEKAPAEIRSARFVVHHHRSNHTQSVRTGSPIGIWAYCDDGNEAD